MWGRGVWYGGISWVLRREVGVLGRGRGICKGREVGCGVYV